ncbi:molybdenum cofactor guanylyltransferase [[Phormidium] sp. ETS-05]|uniref:molybdenum cofactor guanylyltransferase n=1 Tax=[Phormidium] sp. ETS-05 TaxID=222819 RepID=UPI001E43821D|nr:molybdenum cofactor guanylyltransferase [[Phormidium] sp. ETS-05]
MIKALVLAGGESSRMGTDKALILWNGEPMLALVCRSAWGCCEDVSVLTPWPDRYRKTVESRLLAPTPNSNPNSDEKIRWLEESRSGRGPLFALAEGWQQILMLAFLQGEDAEWLLLLGCDLPLLQPEILRRWASQLPNLPNHILALVPQREGRWEPLCGFYRRPALEHLKEFIAAGGRPSLQKWLALLPVQPLILAETEARMLLNCNRPSDLDHPPL